MSEFKAYIAGLLDGEGYIFIHKYRNYMSLRVGISNTYVPVLKYVKEYYGGNIYKHIRQKKIHKIGYEWVLQNKYTKQFLKDMLPFLIIKSKRAKLALDFIKFKESKNRKQLTPHPSKTGTLIWTKTKRTLKTEKIFRTRMLAYNKRGTQ